jgi:alpha-galactosidase
MEIVANYSGEKPPLTLDFENQIWAPAHLHPLKYDWRGEPAPAELKTSARLLWTDEEIFIGYTCSFTEMDIDDEYSPAVERYGLWDRDVCEIFVRSPLEPAPTSYLEFEVAPTGQWCDLRVDRAQMTHDWEWKSGMRTAGEINHQKKEWRVLMALPFSCFGIAPEAGGEWAANLFRVSWLNGERIYLAYSPTGTERPNYHVPERFVTLRFSK